MEKLRILVVDGLKKNLDAAKEQLGNDHELTTCWSFKQAELKLWNTNAEDYFLIGPFYHYGKEPLYDVVFIDTFLPFEQEDWENQKGTTPYGLVLAMLSLRRGIKMIAIMNNSSDENDPNLSILLAMHPTLVCRYNENFINFGDSKFINLYLTEKDYKGTLERFFI